MSLDLFLELLDRDESKTLDFKRKFYAFTADAPKSLKKVEDGEFIKDLLSFYNTKRADTAYIILGVDEDENKGKVLYGIDEIVDEAI